MLPDEIAWRTADHGFAPRLTAPKKHPRVTPQHDAEFTEPKVLNSHYVDAIFASRKSPFL